jgi:hypothetical protein
MVRGQKPKAKRLKIDILEIIPTTAPVRYILCTGL